MTSWAGREPFDQLPAAARQRLLRAAELAQYARQDVVFREGEPAEFLWIVRSGWIQLVMPTAHRQGLTVDLVTAKDRLCGLSAFCGGVYVTSAVACTPAALVRLPATLVQGQVAEHPAFAAAVVTLYSRRFHHMAAAYAMAFAPVEARVAAVLLRLEEDLGLTLPVTRRQVAELAGTTVETAIRVTNRLRRDRLLRMRRGEIGLTDPAGLAQRLRPADRLDRPAAARGA